MEFERKANRLREYDYSVSGYYFLTVCTENYENFFWENSQTYGLNKTGQIVHNAVLEIDQHYEGIKVEKFVVMPNHVHLILHIEERADQKPQKSTSEVIRQFKGIVTKRIGRKIWQRTYYDHVIRSEKGFLEIWKYIDDNPLKWTLDQYYIRR